MPLSVGRATVLGLPDLVTPGRPELSAAGISDVELSDAGHSPRDLIKGGTTVVEVLRQFPGGEAARLMQQLSWPCAHCGGAFHEPLAMAAKRHRNSPRAVLEAFRALYEPDGPSPEQISAAAAKHLR